MNENDIKYTHFIDKKLKPSWADKIDLFSKSVKSLAHVLLFICEPRHDKTNKMNVRPAKT